MVYQSAFLYIKRFILRNWLTQLWEIARPKSVEQTRRLETQAEFLGQR